MVGNISGSVCSHGGGAHVCGTPSKDIEDGSYIYTGVCLRCGLLIFALEGEFFIWRTIGAIPDYYNKIPAGMWQCSYNQNRHSPISSVGWPNEDHYCMNCGRTLTSWNYHDQANNADYLVWLHEYTIVEEREPQ